MLALVIVLGCGSERVSSRPSSPAAPSAAALGVPEGHVGYDFYTPEIAFASSRVSSAYHLFVMNTDGSALRELIPGGGGGDADPDWAPDGETIIFSRARGFCRLDYCEQIRTIKADGAQERPLTTSSGRNENPVWSPNGAKIAFVRWVNRQSGRQQPEIYVMNADGSQARRLTRSKAWDEDPSWSPDGTQIVFSSARSFPDYDLYVMNADGSGQHRLTSGRGLSDYGPDWSPDGRQIVFWRRAGNGDEIFLINPDGTGLRNLTRNLWGDLFPAWSPDGGQIAFASSRDFNDSDSICVDIFIMNADGTEPRNLTNDDTCHQYETPSWSPLMPSAPTSQGRGGLRDGVTRQTPAADGAVVR
jgi:Tol biopolymer transport system component